MSTSSATHEPRVPGPVDLAARTPVPGSGPAAGRLTTTAYVVAYFLAYVALLTPVINTLALKVDALSDASSRAGDLALVTAVGAFFAFVANPVAGALSDRTTSRLGMRRPWLLWGVVGGFAGLLVIGLAQDILTVVVGWALAQTAFNAMQAALQAILPDQVAESRRARVSGLLGIATSLAPVVGIALVTLFTSTGAGQLWWFVVPSALGLVGVLFLFTVMQDRHLEPGTVPPFRLGAFLKDFWVSPRRHPDFAWAFTGRFLLFLGFAVANTYLVYYMLDRFGFDPATAVSWQLRLMLLQTVLLVVAATAGGFVSDRTGRRKGLVVASSVLAGAGLLTYAFAPAPEVMYVAAGLFGIGLGVYFAVDLALVTDVLPNRESEAAKNMGVFNIANALPQSLAPAVAPALLGVGVAAGHSNYALLFGAGAAVMVLGAVSTLFVKGAK